MPHNIKLARLTDTELAQLHMEIHKEQRERRATKHISKMSLAQVQRTLTRLKKKFLPPVD